MQHSINIIHPTRSDTKNTDGKFLFQTRVWEATFTYLTTDPKNGTSDEDWGNNFSTFFDIKNGNAVTMGIIGLSTGGISLFDDSFQNRRDQSMPRTSTVYRLLEQIERRMRQTDTLTTSDNLHIRWVWAEHNPSEE
jgi:hypothetical protein